MRTILVADEDQATRVAVSTILQDRGFSVVMASNAARARTVLEDNPTVLGMIVDATLSTGRGERLVAELRTEDRFHELPIIVLGASAKVGEILHSLDQGASRFVAKNALEAGLLEEIDALLTS